MYHSTSEGRLRQRTTHDSPTYIWHPFSPFASWVWQNLGNVSWRNLKHLSCRSGKHREKIQSKSQANISCDDQELTKVSSVISNFSMSGRPSFRHWLLNDRQKPIAMNNSFDWRNEVNGSNRIQEGHPTPSKWALYWWMEISSASRTDARFG